MIQQTNNSIAQQQKDNAQPSLDNEQQTHALIYHNNLKKVSKKSKGVKSKNKKKRQVVNKYKQQINHIDKILIAAAFVLMVVVIMGQFLINYIEKQNEKQKIQFEYYNRYKKNLSDKYTAMILQRNSQIKQTRQTSGQNQFNFKLINGKKVFEQIQKLKQKNCNEYNYYQYSKQQYANLPENKNRKQIQLQDKQNGQDSNIQNSEEQLRRKQEEQNSNVARINQLQMRQSKKKQTFTVTAGITQQKIKNAKSFDKFSAQLLPWQQNEQTKKQYDYFQSIYKIGSYTEQLPICVVVPTFNNQQKDRYKLNLKSIVQQNYTNYHVVIIEDASTDKTAQLIDSYVKQVKEQWLKRGKQIKIDVYNNQVQRRAMPNLRKAAMQYCKQNEIFMIIDGDDRLIGKQIFKLYNAQYQEKKSWFVYSNFISFVGTPGFSKPIKQQVMKENRYRESNFVTSHLRSFYTKLFRLIKQQDLKDKNGEYLRAGNDIAICIPILQMSHTRVSYVPEVTYLYNSNTGLNNHLVRIKQQIDNSRGVRWGKKYQPLTQLNFN